MGKARNQGMSRAEAAGWYAPGTLVYKRLVHSVRRRLGSDDAEDVVQDAYLRLVSAERREPVREPGAFLNTVTTNLVRDRVRAANVRLVTAGELPADARCPEPDAARILSSREQLAVLERALAELPPKRRAAIVLKRIDGKSHAEIAEMLGLSVSMVEKHIRFALEHCRQRLAEANGDA